MDRKELKELIQEVYDDYDFVNFTLHFVDQVEAHKVYEIKNNRINNKLKDTTLISVNGELTNEYIRSASLYGIDIKEHLIREMIGQSADKILTDIYKFNTRDWFYGQKTVDVEMSISNWSLQEEKTGNSIVYSLRFEVA